MSRTQGDFFRHIQETDMNNEMKFTMADRVLSVMRQANFDQQRIGGSKNREDINALDLLGLLCHTEMLNLGPVQSENLARMMLSGIPDDRLYYISEHFRNHGDAFNFEPRYTTATNFDINMAPMIPLPVPGTAAPLIPLPVPGSAPALPLELPGPIRDSLTGEKRNDSILTAEKCGRILDKVQAHGRNDNCDEECQRDVADYSRLLQAQITTLRRIANCQGSDCPTERDASEDVNFANTACNSIDTWNHQQVRLLAEQRSWWSNLMS